MSDLIRVQPARHLRQAFARWAVAQRPPVRTVSESAFGVPAPLFTDMPEDLLRGSLVDGRPYVAVEEPTPPAPPGAPELTGVDTPRAGAAPTDGLRDAAPGRPLPEAPPLPDFAPLEDAPADEAGELTGVPSRGGTGPGTGVPHGDSTGDTSPSRPVTTGSTRAVTSEDTPGDMGDTSGDTAAGYVCPRCPRTFTTERGLHTHRGMVHQDEGGGADAG